MPDGPDAKWPTVSPFRAGIACRCPRCGQGALYDGILSVAENCGVCSLDLTPHDSGDGPAVFAIFFLGFLVVPLALWLEVVAAPPMWVHVAIWPPVIIVLAVICLRLMKAVLIAYHFRNLRHVYDE